MAIRLDPPRTDAQGLPVVSWEEDRNLFAPDGISPARVACFIRPDKETGVLQFVSVGSVRHGQFEEARPWEKLVSFSTSTAEQHYRSAGERALIDVLASKSKSGAGRILAADGAHVMLANFADDRPSVPMHLNCAECAPVEMALLHDRLHREFISKRRDLVYAICDGEFSWPKDKPFVADRRPETAAVPQWLARAIDLSIAAVLGLIGWGIYELLLR
ncbi:MAG: hypothetical protein ACLPWS_10785 [Rhodomicrobium sp.]